MLCIKPYKGDRTVLDIWEDIIYLGTVHRDEDYRGIRWTARDKFNGPVAVRSGPGARAAAIKALRDSYALAC